MQVAHQVCIPPMQTLSSSKSEFQLVIRYNDFYLQHCTAENDKNSPSLQCASMRVRAFEFVLEFCQRPHALGKGSVGMVTRYSTCHLPKDWASKSARASMMRNSMSELRVFYLRLPRLIVALQRAVDCIRKEDTES